MKYNIRDRHDYNIMDPLRLYASAVNTMVDRGKKITHYYDYSIFQNDMAYIRKKDEQNTLPIQLYGAAAKIIFIMPSIKVARGLNWGHNKIIHCHDNFMEQAGNSIQVYDDILPFLFEKCDAMIDEIKARDRKNWLRMQEQMKDSERLHRAGEKNLSRLG